MDLSGQAGFAGGAAPPSRSLLQRGIDWARRVRLERKLTIFLVVAAVLSGITTFTATTGRLPGAIGSTTLFILLLLDFIFLLCLGAIIARRLVLLWGERRRGLAGARLHGRLIGLFSLVAVTPAIVVAVFSAILFDFGFRVWFSDRVSTVVRNSLSVAEAYLQEHQMTASGEALAIARSLNSLGPISLIEPYQLQQLLGQQVAARSLAEAVIFDGARRELARGGYSIWAEFDPRALPEEALAGASGGDVVILPQQGEARVGVLVRLDSFTDTFLYIGRLVDAQILGQLDQSRGAVRLYEELEGERYDLQITFALIFLMVAGLLLLVAIWVGLVFANHLTRPLGRLVEAAQRVGKGDLSARVPVETSGDEIASLSQAFNRMTGELEQQRGKLLAANRQVEERRRFIEAVLGGVSSAVVGLDPEGQVTLINRAAQTLLAARTDELRGRPLAEIMPDSEVLIRAARMRPGRAVERQLTITDSKGQERTVFARVVAQIADEGVVGLVCTIDDITELLGAQRKAAWSDIARRIAHEIKNPLTPIQLSAERLKRRYLGEITSDPETFAVCTDTIVRQVGDIGRMVDEFSSFARMPAPIMTDQDLAELIKQAVFLQRAAHPTLDFEVQLPATPLILVCDGQQIGRALTNLLLNAVEAIDGRNAEDGQALRGRIEVATRMESEGFVVEVLDNGKGLPKSDRHRLTEPYVTTRPRGTGLGLAIVKKIMEEHGGEVTLDDRPEGGARVRLLFPRSRIRTAAKLTAVQRLGSEQAG